MYSSAKHDLITQELQLKIKILHDSIWDRKADWPVVLKWLSQFDENSDPDLDEQLLALRLLSHFMYFGASEIRALLRSLYRDTFRPHLARKVRSMHGGSGDQSVIGPALENELKATRFVSLGNPSESSAMLLYYFRQENRLHKDLFIHPSDIFDLALVGSAWTVQVRDKNVRHYVFIDDLCGSGHQGTQYSKSIVGPLRALKPDVQTYYYPLFGMTDGVDVVRQNALFNIVLPVVELDETFKAFSVKSRLYNDAASHHLLLRTENVCRRHGDQLWPAHPLGYDDGQLYIGFAHNTPDNSLPVFWSDDFGGKMWIPIFKRYPKVF